MLHDEDEEDDTSMDDLDEVTELSGWNKPANCFSLGLASSQFSLSAFSALDSISDSMFEMSHFLDLLVGFGLANALPFSCGLDNEDEDDEPGISDKDDISLL